MTATKHRGDAQTYRPTDDVNIKTDQQAFEQAHRHTEGTPETLETQKRQSNSNKCIHEVSET